MSLLDALANAPWMAALVVIPLAGATIAFALGSRAAARIAFAAATATTAAAAGLSYQVWSLGAQRYAVGGWGAPLGTDLAADGLSVLMVLMTAAVAVPVTVYARSYFDAGSGFWTLCLFLWASLNALFLSADVFTLYITLELVTLSAVGLAALGGGAAVRASLRYLLAALLGSLLYLMAVALLYWTAGTLDLYLLRASADAGVVPGIALALAATGLFVKSALFPLHFWLPAAHANAPAPVSALLSSLVVKASYYLLLRLWLDTFDGVVAREAAVFVGLLGTGAIVWGSLQAMLAERIKLVVAYSTVAQLGYLFLVFPLVAAGAGAWEAGALYALSHACAKAALFLSAGAIVYASGDDRIDGLTGLASRLPMPVMTIALTGVALMGLPPSGTFAAKWLLIAAALESPHPWVAAVVVSGGLLAAGYIFRVIAPAMASPPDDAPPLRRVPGAMRWSALALAVAAVLLGAATTPAMQLLEIRPAAVDTVAGTMP